jgi:uncharacterized protein YcbX
MATDHVVVGRVVALYRYPVKSMRGERLAETTVAWTGIEGDRRYAFVKSGSPLGFPWLTGRELPEMVRYVPRYADPSNPRESEVIVTTPEGRDLPIHSPALLDALVAAYGAPAHLMALNRGCHDSLPLSLISTATVAAMGQEAGLALDPRRFRPNVVIELAEPVAYGEEGWLGAALLFGELPGGAEIRVSRRNVRCVFTNVDPETGERDPRVLKTIVQTRDECLGVHASVQRPGTIREGDAIYRVD